MLATAALWPLLGRNSSAFLPHWFCFLGDRPLIYTHLVSDLIIGLSYVAISLTFAWIVHAPPAASPSTGSSWASACSSSLAVEPTSWRW